MNSCIRLLSATALLAIVLPVQAGLPPRTPAPPPKAKAETAPPAPLPTTPADQDLVWPPELKAGRRAWSLTELELKDPFKPRVAGQKVPANAELRLHDSMTQNGVVLWKVEAVASKAAGWTPAETLTRTWPKSDADTLVPILGDRTTEITRLLAQIDSADPKVRFTAYQEIYLSGITDEKLFDAIAVRLISNVGRADAISSQMWGSITAGIVAGLLLGPAGTAGAMGSQPNRKDWAREIVLQTRALASSGYSKYRPMLERAAETDQFGTGTLSSKANAALDELEKFARWNRIINDPANHNPDQPHESTRLINMLRSGERILQIPAVQRIGALKQPALFDALEAEFARTYRLPLDDEQSDAAAWMAKGLGGSGDAKYRATLADAAANASTSKVRSRAADGVEELDKAAKKN